MSLVPCDPAEAGVDRRQQRVTRQTPQPVAALWAELLPVCPLSLCMGISAPASLSQSPRHELVSVVTRALCVYVGVMSSPGGRRHPLAPLLLFLLLWSLAPHSHRPLWWPSGRGYAHEEGSQDGEGGGYGLLMSCEDMHVLCPGRTSGVPLSEGSHFSPQGPGDSGPLTGRLCGGRVLLPGLLVSQGNCRDVFPGSRSQLLEQALVGDPGLSCCSRDFRQLPHLGAHRPPQISLSHCTAHPAPAEATCHQHPSRQGPAPGTSGRRAAADSDYCRRGNE